MGAKLTKDHHLLTRNLKLNGHYISNDGGDEGITVSDAGIVTVSSDLVVSENLSITEEYSNTSAVTLHSIDINLVKTGASTSNNEIHGIDVTVSNETATDGQNSMTAIRGESTLIHAADAGLTLQYGGYFTGTGSLNGALSLNECIGIYARADDADKNYGAQLIANGSATNTGCLIKCTTSGATNTGLFINSKDGGTDFKNVSSASTLDYFSINTIENGETTLTTIENGGNSTAHLNMDPDGDFTVDAEGNISLDTGGQQLYIKSADNDFVKFDYSTGEMIMYPIGSATDYLRFDVGANGRSYIQTVDEGMGVAGHLDIIVDGTCTIDAIKDITLDAADDNIKMLGSGGSGLDFIQSGTGDWTIKNLTSDKDIIFNVNDGGGDTEVMRLDGDVSAVKIANIVYFAAETANVIGDGATGDIDWNVSQKQKVTITGTHITCNFTDPAGACNLLLKVVQGDGSDIIGTWDGDILWAGGNAPTLSTGNGEIDVLSFYWDGSKYYGVASLDFS